MINGSLVKIEQRTRGAGSTCAGLVKSVTRAACNVQRVQKSHRKQKKSSQK
jgi:hypothetical protein